MSDFAGRKEEVLSRWLHDELSQIIMSARFSVNVLPSRTPIILANLHQLISIKNEQLHKGLRIEDTFLENYCMLFEDAREKLLMAEIIYPFSIEKKFVGDQFEVPDDYTSNLISILGEALSNAGKYSKSEKVIVNITVDEGNVTLTISDFGIGMKLGDKPIGTGHGHENMKSRVLEMGGELLITSDHGEGMEISVKVPLDRL